WGAPEDDWTLQGMRGLDSAFASGSARGVTYSAAAGDAGSTNAETDGLQHAEFPASSPSVWACGGTAVLAAAGRITREVVWNELRSGAGAGWDPASGWGSPDGVRLAAVLGVALGSPAAAAPALS